MLGLYDGRTSAGGEMSRLLTTITTGALLLALQPAATWAAKPGPMPNPAILEALIKCRTVSGDAERLACFDKAAAAVERATTNGDLVALDREQRRQARRQAFGFLLPSLSFLERGEKTGEIDHLTAIAADAGLNTLGEWVITLDDGAVWRQTEPVELGRTPHKGSKVMISKGVLGSYFMTIDGEGAGKAKRES